jgi:hypothetical protein
MCTDNRQSILTRQMQPQQSCPWRQIDMRAVRLTLVGLAGKLCTPRANSTHKDITNYKKQLSYMLITCC